MQPAPPHFKILVLGPFDANTSRVWDSAPVPVDRTVMDDVMAAMDIELWLPLESDVCPQGGIAFHFKRFKDLHPDGLIADQPFLVQADQADRFLIQARKDGLSSTQIKGKLAQWPDLPAVDIPDPPRRNAASPANPPGDAVDNLLNMIAVPETRTAPASHIDQTGASPFADLTTRILQTLFGASAFRGMEAAWRGLRLLLQQGAIEEHIKVELATVHPATLEATLDSLEAHLFHNPPNMVLLDLGFDNTPLSMERLARAAQWAGTLMVPLIAWVPPGFWGIDGWQGLPALPFLPHHLEGSTYAKFQNLRNGPDSHWVCLTCNGFVIRFPYGPENPPRRIDFIESEPLWISTPWALGTLVAQAVARSGRPARFTDHQHYRIQDLALHSGKGPQPVAVETILNSDRLDQMIRSGITPMTAHRDTGFVPQAVTLSGNSLAYQLITGQVARFILWCKDNLPAETDPSALALQLRLAFQVFSEQSRPPGFVSHDIQAGAPGPNGKIPIQITVTPSAAFLSRQTPIEMQLDW